MLQLIKDQVISEVSRDDIVTKSPYTLLYFYPKNDTPGCTLEAQDFTTLADNFTKKGIQIVGVSKDKAESHCRFIEKYALSPLYLSDPDLELHAKFATRGEKNNYGKIVTGVIRSSFLLNDKGETIHEWKSIRAKGHADRVLKWVTERSSERESEK